MNDKTTDPAEKMPEEEKVSRHFIEREIDKDLRDGVYDSVHTRFPFHPLFPRPEHEPAYPVMILQ